MEADASFWCWILNEYIQLKFKNRQEICRFVITSFKNCRIKTLGCFMSYLWKKCDDVIDVQNSCFTHETSCLFVVTFSLPYQGTKKCDGVKNSCVYHKTDRLFVCLFLYVLFVLHVRSCCNHGNLPTVLSSSWRLWSPEGILTKSWTWYPLNFSRLFSELWTWVYLNVLETDVTRISDQKIRKIFCTWSSLPHLH